MWLVKPANLNQGRGIEIFRTLKQILTFLGSKPLNSLWVVQKYIEKPLLYYGRKFDIRVWVIVTGRNEIYFYRKVYIRTSSD
jgi:tubulin monoglycylase TTLL3/8